MCHLSSNPSSVGFHVLRPFSVYKFRIVTTSQCLGPLIVTQLHFCPLVLYSALNPNLSDKSFFWGVGLSLDHLSPFFDTISPVSYGFMHLSLFPKFNVNIFFFWESNVIRSFLIIFNKLGYFSPNCFLHYFLTLLKVHLRFFVLRPRFPCYSLAAVRSVSLCFAGPAEI